jgi:hypothetical protein
MFFRFILPPFSQRHHEIQKVILYESVLLPEDERQNIDRLSGMSMQDYTTVLDALQSLMSNISRPNINLIFTREIDLFLRDWRET